jgi:hypothetical protein
MADPNIYPTYFDTYSKTKNKPFLKRKRGDVMNVAPDMSATPGYVDPNLPLTKKYVTGPLNQKSFVTAPTKEQKDAMYKPYSEPRKEKYTDSLFPTLPSVSGINPYFTYEKLDWQKSLDLLGQEFLGTEKGGTGFSLKTPEQGANYRTVTWNDAGFTAPDQGVTTGEQEEIYFNPTTRQVVRAPHEGFIAPEGWVSLKNIKPIAPDVPEDFARGPEPARYITKREPYTYEDFIDTTGEGDWGMGTVTGYEDVNYDNPAWVTWSQTPDSVRDDYEQELNEFEKAMRIYEERQAQIDEFEDFTPEFGLQYDPSLAIDPGNLMDQAVRLFQHFDVPMRIDPVSGKLVINNRTISSIQDLRNEHRKLVGQTGAGTFDVPVGMDPASLYRMNMFTGGASYYYDLKTLANPYGDVWADTIDPEEPVLPQIVQVVQQQEEEEEDHTNVDGDPDADEEGEGEGEGDEDAGGPCWVAGTQILMEDGSCKNIENLKIGDMVMSFPENSKIRRWNTPLEAKPIINLLVSKADIWHLNDSMVSENEWMVKADGTASLVQWLNVGDELMDEYGNKVKVYRNEPAEGKLSRQVVYNFESENNYSYIANNMRTLKGKAVRMSESKMNSFGEGYFSDESSSMKQGWSMQDEYKRKFGN